MLQIDSAQGKEEELQEAATLADYGPAAFLAPSTAYRCSSRFWLLLYAIHMLFTNHSTLCSCTAATLRVGTIMWAAGRTLPQVALVLATCVM